MIIHDSKIIFVHIPKTGGTTIEKILENTPNVGEPDKTFGVHHRLEQPFDKWAGEDTKEEDRKNIGSYHMFVVARNPWERYASMYVHDIRAFEDNIATKKPPAIEEYMEKNVEENFFRFIEVNGTIPDNLMIMNFNDFNKEVLRIWSAMGLPRPKLVHENKKHSKYTELQKEICGIESFQKAVAELCEAEIELFGYNIPV